MNTAFRHRLNHSIEILEPRIAPALVLLPPTSISPDGKLATFQDSNGDIVSVSTDTGQFTAENFTFFGDDTTGEGKLRSIDVSAAKFGKQFQGATIMARVTHVGPDSVGLCQLRYLNATGVDLRYVEIAGDLGEIDAGDSNVRTRGLGTLDVFSFGQSSLGAATSTILGKLGTLKVRAPATVDYGGLFSEAFLDVTGGPNPANAKFGDIGAIKIGHLDGGHSITTYAGREGKSAVTFADGSIRASGSIGSVLVHDVIHGGTNAYTGVIWARAGIGSVKVGTAKGAGDLLGGSDYYSGAIFTGSPDKPNATAHGGAIGPVVIKGSIIGGIAKRSGTIYGGGGITSVFIGDDLQTGAEAITGAIVSGSHLGPVFIGDDLVATAYPGNIIAHGDAESITVNGSIRGGRYAISVFGTLGTLNAGSIRGGTAIAAFGPADASGNPLPGLAFGTINIAHEIEGGFIFTGYDQHLDFTGGNPKARHNPYAGIGTITVGGTVANLVIAAGVLPGPDDAFGNADDTLMPRTNLAFAPASIASIIIKDTLRRTIVETHHIGFLQLKNLVLPLTAGLNTVTGPDNIVFREL